MPICYDSQLVVAVQAKEFKKWAPQLNTIVYVGDGESRAVCRDYEFVSTKTKRPQKFNILLTTYELVLKDAPILRQVPLSPSLSPHNL